MALVEPMLALRGIGKSYGPVRALAGIDLDIAAREVVGICGDNGAGKSTLIRILSGAERPSEGEIRANGKVIAITSPGDALARGIATIYQDLALAPRLSIAQNIFMGAELVRGPRGLGRHAPIHCEWPPALAAACERWGRGRGRATERAGDTCLHFGVQSGRRSEVLQLSREGGASSCFREKL